MPRRKVHSSGRSHLPSDLSFKTIGILSGLIAAGFSISLYLTYVHRRMRLDADWSSLCDFGPSMSCDVVVSSNFGVVLGAPLALYAAWFYLVLGSVVLISLRTERTFPRSPALLITIGGGAASAVSVILAVISLVWIRSFCLLCGALYVVNVALLVVGWRALNSTGERFTTAVSAERRYIRRHVLPAFAFSGGAFILLVLIPWTHKTPAVQHFELCDLLTEPGMQAPYTLEIYSAFQCPHCRTLDLKLRPLRGRRELQVTRRHYPYDTTCNPRLSRSPHAGGCRQALAAICAGEQGRYDAFSDRLYDEQRTDAAGLIALAASLELDRASFERCLSSERSGEQLASDIFAGNQGDIRRIPAIFINGRRLTGNLVDEEIACLERETR